MGYPYPDFCLSAFFGPYFWRLLASLRDAIKATLEATRVAMSLKGIVEGLLHGATILLLLILQVEKGYDATLRDAIRDSVQGLRSGLL